MSNKEIVIKTVGKDERFLKIEKESGFAFGNFGFDMPNAYSFEFEYEDTLGLIVITIPFRLNRALDEKFRLANINAFKVIDKEGNFGDNFVMNFNPIRTSLFQIVNEYSNKIFSLLQAETDLENREDELLTLDLELLDKIINVNDGEFLDFIKILFKEEITNQTVN